MYLIMQRLLARLVKASASAQRLEVCYGFRRFALIQQVNNNTPRM